MRHFLEATADVGVSGRALTLCQNFAKFNEERFTRAAPGADRKTLHTRAHPLRHITWATLNVRSIYGREETLMEMMRHHRIGFLALQETFERPTTPRYVFSTQRIIRQVTMAGEE